MDLYHTGVGKVGTLLIAEPGGRSVACQSIGGEEVSITIATSSDYDSVSTEALQLTGHEVSSDDTASSTVNDHEVDHLITGVELYVTKPYLTHQTGVGSEEELLTGLSP